MRYRRFGRTGWQVSEIGYGMWGMGGWTGSDDAESLKSLQRSVELGCNFFDTAWGYGEGHSEGLLGKLVRANPGKNSIQLQRSPRRTSFGPAAGVSHWMSVSHQIISRNTCTKAWKTQG
jgi:predicted aldo/keto reductase-like oxidoreductase